MENAKFKAIVDEMISKATKIVTNRDFSTSYKESQISSLRQAGLQELQRVGKQEIDNLSAARNSAAQTALVPFAPSAEDANRLMYVKSALQAKYQNLDRDEWVTQTRADWKNALDGNDHITMRVMRDFFSQYHDDLVEATNKQLIPKSAQEAKEIVDKSHLALQIMQSELSEAQINVEHTQFQEDGTVVDGMLVVYMNQRSSF